MIMKQFENNGVTSNETTVGEFERSPVPNSKLKNWKSFVGMYAWRNSNNL